MSNVDDIKLRIDIVDLVSGYVDLQKAGRNFKALCPFHTEKTPSFVVNPERQSWRCFGACATGGDVFSFVMRMEKLDFSEAVRLLAQKAGVTISQKRGVDRHESLFQINQEAARFYQGLLESSEGKSGMDYLAGRGVDAKVMSAFQLGLSLRGRDRLKTHLSGLGFDPGLAVEAGLLRRGEDSTLKDFFWGRLMFPIHDREGRVAGFGARSLDGSEPKYLNTAATPIFDKRSILYGLHMAEAGIRERGTVVIVEGYMDAITAHQYGYTNVVASMGTALTGHQVSLIRSAANHFVQALDPDDAGKKATLRSLESSWRAVDLRQLGRTEELDLKIASLPSGLDPDSLIREDPEEWKRRIQEAVPYMDFRILNIPFSYDIGSDHGKAQAAEEHLPLITAMGNAFEQERYFRMLAQVLSVSKEALEASIGRPRRGVPTRSHHPSTRDPTRAPSLSPLSSSRQDFLEDYTLALLLSRPELKERARTLPPEWFHNTENSIVFTSWLGCSTISELRDCLDDNLYDCLDNLCQLDLPPFDNRSAEAAIGQSLERLEQRHLKELQEVLLASQDATLPPPRELEGPIVSVNTRLKELFAQRS